MAGSSPLLGPGPSLAVLLLLAGAAPPLASAQEDSGRLILVIRNEEDSYDYDYSGSGSGSGYDYDYPGSGSGSGYDYDYSGSGSGSGESCCPIWPRLVDYILGFITGYDYFDRGSGFVDCSASEVSSYDSYSYGSYSYESYYGYGYSYSGDYYGGSDDVMAACWNDTIMGSCDKVMWVSEHRPTVEDIVLFNCNDDNEESGDFCIDAAFVCDGHPMCPNGADEEKTDDNPDGLRCRKFTKSCPYPDGQIQCKKMGGVDWTVGHVCAGATNFCDGVEYCDVKGEDEKNC
jgi:hypothetical protein